MKTIPVNLAAHIATKRTTLATALKVTREDGTVYGWTTHDINDPVDNGDGGGEVTYLANPGLKVTAIQIASGAAVGNLELTTLHDGTVFTTGDILGGKWRNAAFSIFRYNYDALADGVEWILAGTLGEFSLRKNTVIIELRDLRQYLQQTVGSASSKTCRARLGDSLCTVSLVGSPGFYTVTGTLDSVTSQQIFRDSTRTEAADFFGEGTFEFTSGANAGQKVRVKEYAADGTFTLWGQMFGTVDGTETYEAVAGCRKRIDEDCIAKFDNVLNFQGEPHRKGIDDLTKSPKADV